MPRECQQIVKDSSTATIKATSHSSRALKAAEEGVRFFATESYVIHVHRDADNTKGRAVFAHLLPSKISATTVTGVAIQFVFAIPTRSLSHRSKRHVRHIAGRNSPCQMKTLTRGEKNICNGSSQNGRSH